MLPHALLTKLMKPIINIYISQAIISLCIYSYQAVGSQQTDRLRPSLSLCALQAQSFVEPPHHSG